MTSVGVVYNLKRESAEDDEPPDSCAEYDCESTVTAVADALRSYGYNVSLIEASMKPPISSYLPTSRT